MDATNQPANANFPPANASGIASYSIVFSNRLPAAGGDSTLFLVSLESYATYLPDDQGNASTAFTSAPTSVRLASLYSWSFDALPQTAYFEDIVSALSVQPAGVQLPVESVTTQNPAADAFVATAFDNGYAALMEALPDGTPTASWYRGPLLPATSATPYLTPPYPGPDGLRRFDPNTGMFDISYAAAWQLGQLLALQSATFSSALYRWNLSEMSATAGSQQQQAFHSTVAATASAAQLTVPGIVQTLVKPAADALKQQAARKIS